MLQTWLTVVLTLYYEIMKVTQLERVNSELKRRFYKQNSTNGISVNTGNVFYTKTMNFTLSKQESVLGEIR